MEDLAKQMTKGFGWSPAVFKDDYRNLENFQQMEVIALDFDEGMKLEEASLLFSGYQHVIGTSRNHGKEKKLPSGKIKPACDRFRVVFRLSRPITTDAEYRSTFETLRQKWPQADPVCNNADRFFYPCTEIYQGDDTGDAIEPVEPIPEAAKLDRRELTEGERGKLARATLEFITVGTLPEGSKGRHAALFKAAKDFQEQGFSEDEALDFLLRCPLVDEPGMPIKDFEKAVKSAFKKEPKYEPRSLPSESSPGRAEAVSNREKPEGDIKNQGSLHSLSLLEEALAHLSNPEAVKGTSTGWKEIDAVLGGLRQSELGIIQAYPKSGKTVFLTNLMVNLTEAGHKVGFASLEMHPAKQVEPDLYCLLLKKDIRKGVTEEDKAKLTKLLEAGRGLTYFKRERRPTAEEICSWIIGLYKEGVRHFFIDHFHKFVSDESSVAAIAKTITSLTGVKYECPEAFIALVVQPTKEQRGRDGLSERVGKNTLRGGASIFDECDWLINLHTKYQTFKIRETPWGERHDTVMASYPNDIRELEFEAIRAKPFSENMGTKLHMKYNKGTTEMAPYKWIAPEPERIALPERDEDEESRYRRRPQGNREQSGWARKTWGDKKV
jgi:hypothetical protein